MTTTTEEYAMDTTTTRAVTCPRHDEMVVEDIFDVGIAGCEASTTVAQLICNARECNVDAIVGIDKLEVLR